MKNHHFTSLPILVVFLACNTGTAGAQLSQADIALANAYAIAWSYPDYLPQYVQKNASFFVEGGPSIVRGQVLAGQLFTKSLLRPTPNQIREQAMDIAGRAGAPELGGRLGDDMVNSNTDMFLLAGSIQELVNALPSIVQGNNKPYTNTSLYQNAALIWWLMESVGGLSPEYNKALRDLTLELNVWYVGWMLMAVE